MKNRIRLMGRLLAGILLATLPLGVVGSVAEIVSPVPGSNLSKNPLEFRWTAGAGGRFVLDVGTEGVGSSDVFRSGFLEADVMALEVPDIPSRQPIYVRLWSERAPGANSYFISDYTYNTDLDRDGILDEIDGQAGLTNPMIVMEGSDHRMTLLGSERLASVESPSLFDETKTEVSFAQAQNLARRVYEHFADDFDFLIFASRQPTTPPGSYYGRFYGARNQIDGIGIGHFDDTSSFGSAGQLQGVIHLTSVRGLPNGPSLHELAHNWGHSMRSIPTAVGNHWGYSNVGGQLGGWQPGSLLALGENRYQARNPRSGEIGPWGSFANGGNGLPYSEFELYTMGLIEAGEVTHDIKIANDFAWFDTDDGIFSASSIKTVTMDEIIKIDGRRLPAPATSQRAFRALYIILTDRPLTLGEWQRLDQDVYQFQLPENDGERHNFNFWEATRGLATLSMDGLTQHLIDRPDGAPRLTNLRFSPTDPRVTLIDVRTETGFVYSLEHSTDLTTWNRGNSLLGTGRTLTFSSPPFDGPVRFFRVIRTQE